MSNQKIREEFEAWANGRYGWEIHDQYRDESERTLSTWNGERYDNRIVEGMWQAWQASREALVINMPIDATGGLYRLALEDCAYCIEAAGVRTSK